MVFAPGLDVPCREHGRCSRGEVRDVRSLAGSAEMDLALKPDQVGKIPVFGPALLFVVRTCPPGAVAPSRAADR